jgi:antirestriction protein ArdC
MSENFKPLPEQISERMVNLLKDGRSIFTKPMKDEGTSQFVQPINARTKQAYKGATALVLLMQNRRDPRWLSYDQASYNKTPVKKGAHGTLIEFYSNNKLQQATENGQPLKKENGQPKMERVEIDVPEKVEAWLFNGKDLTDLKELKPKPQDLTPMERAQAIIDSSKAKFEAEDWGTHFDRALDTIHMPAKEDFEKPELYYATALHELAHWTSHETRLNGPEFDHPDLDGLWKEELRTNIASILISADLNLPYNLGDHKSDLIPWSQILKENPGELFNAADDAQKIADYVLGLEPKREQKQDIAENKQVAAKLEVGQEIAYNETVFKILEKQSKGAFKIEDIDTHEKIRITPSTGLYKSLLNELNNPGQAKELAQEQEEVPELALAEEETKSYSRKR